MTSGLPPEQELRMLRADAWYHGRDVSVDGVQARLTGPDTADYREDSLVAVFGDDVCLVYVYNTESTPADAVVRLRQVYPLIRKLRVPAERLEYQRQLWQRFMVGVVPSKASLMRIAEGQAEAEDLPIGLLMFGRTVPDGQLIVVLQALMLAPLDLVLEDFKLRTRLFR